MKRFLYLLASLLLPLSVFAHLPVQARGDHANACQRKQARMAARADRRQSLGKRFGNTNESFPQSQPAMINRNRQVNVENDETHQLGYDRSNNRRRRKHDRTESVNTNETITVNSARASGSNSLMEDEGIYYYRKKGKRRVGNASSQQ